MKKRIFYLMALPLLFGMPATTEAQEEEEKALCWSKMETYQNVETDYSIVRCDGTHIVVQASRKETSTGINLHTFWIKDKVTGATNTFQTRFDANDSTEYNVTISDMELFLGECYFCGTITHSIATIDGHLVTEGFVGHFSTQSMLTTSGEVLYGPVKNTTSLSHLAISKQSDNCPHIHAVGETDYSHSAGLAEIFLTLPANWKATLNYISDHPAISFSDILGTADSIILLSQFRCNYDYPENHSEYEENHQKFMLQKFSWEGCYEDYENLLPTSLYMVSYNLTDNYRYHSKNTQMGLCNRGINKFGVAFPVKKYNSNLWGMRYFDFPYIGQYSRSVFYAMGKSPVLRDIGTFPEANSIFILSRDQSHPRGIVSVPFLVGSSSTVKFLYNNNSYLTSVAPYAYSCHIKVTGFDPNHTLQLYEQDLGPIDLECCFSKYADTYVSLPKGWGSSVKVSWETKYVKNDFVWRHANFIWGPIPEIDNTCSKCD